MIIVTGAAGFIGSCLVRKLNDEGRFDLVLVDEFGNQEKEKNLSKKKYYVRINRDEFLAWLKSNYKAVDFIFHIGARTDTAEFDKEVFNRLNLEYSKSIWNSCAEFQIPLLYASSAATYGSGEFGYDDDHALIKKLIPLNPYGESKNDFDKWVLLQENAPPFWAGLKFFNVYGPNEYHKGRMASVVYHAFNQVKSSGKVKLFRSHRPDYKDGLQLRDFIYVKDVAEVCYFFFQHQKNSSIYNLGTGNARSFYDLAAAVFNSMNKTVNIEFIDMPLDIRDKYQYFTEAKMEKLRQAGYSNSFFSLEEGISDYVNNYLSSGNYF